MGWSSSPVSPMSLMSAGTISPSLTITMSPGTNWVASTTSGFPFRMALALGASAAVRALMAWSALDSCMAAGRESWEGTFKQCYRLPNQAYAMEHCASEHKLLPDDTSCAASTASHNPDM